MANLSRGLYEQLITLALEAELDALDDRLEARRSPLHTEETADRVALHVGRLLKQVLMGLDPKERPALASKIAADVTSLLRELSHSGVDSNDILISPPSILRALVRRRPDGTSEALNDPITPLLDTTLLTNAPGEPRVGVQIASEIDSSDRIDILMAFVRRSGIRPFMESLRRHCDEGRKLRVLTTTYTNSTELEALEALRAVGADVRVSYDVSTTRLHAKAWLFHRLSTFSTGYIGSSNLTHSAQISGLEWNVRVSGARNPDVIDKFSAVFDSYWHSEDFRSFDPVEFRELTRLVGNSGPRIYLSPVEIRPEPFQAHLLEQLAIARQQGHHRNLLAAATGTGKTVMAALDYLTLRAQLPRSRLLFVAHRKEILNQSLATFRHALRDPAFGELWVDGQRPERFEHVFASIQSLSAAGLNDLAADQFDVVIVDEFHHAAAATYDALLQHLAPVELLGLTATPERSDGLPILNWFGGRIAAELRLWDAIDQHRLCPFVYYGVHDGLDLTNVTWRRGTGYDVEELSNLVTGNDFLARFVIKEVERKIDTPGQMRALGFCVSVEHARFMAAQFSRAGIPSLAIWAQTESAERVDALKKLAAGTLRVIFSVDLFNEGVDIPKVDTLLLLRPTDSPTLFLQQLGRGLRRSEGKSACTVLDFIGQHRKEYRFDRRLGALLGGSRKALTEQVEHGFPYLPAGCHMELDHVAMQVVLRSLRESLPTNWVQRVAALRQAAGQTGDISLAGFLKESGLSLQDVYSGNRSWSELREAAGLPVLAPGPNESALRRTLGRMLHIDDLERLHRYSSLLKGEDSGLVEERDFRLLRMLVVTVMDSALRPDTSLRDGYALLLRHPQVCSELTEILQVLANRIEHVGQPLVTHPAVPLQVHARYTRLEILAAFASGQGTRLAPWREGARWIAGEGADLLAFTLDKTTGHFSPTTRYRDYAISRDLLHWESQSTTREGSPTGRRYQAHETQGSSILLFARLSTDDRSFWFLGPASYVSHRGERPMAITWRLSQPLPGDLFAQFAAAVA